MDIELDSEFEADLFVVDSVGDPVTGLVDGNFTKYLYNPSESEVWSSQGGSISELGNGGYRISFTPNAIGTWNVIVVHSSYGTFANSYRCTSSLQDLADIESKIDTVDGNVDSIVGKLPSNNIADQTLVDTDLSNIETDTQDIQSKIGSPPSDLYTDLKSEIDDNEGKIDTIDSVVDEIKSKTDNLPGDPASETNVDANETKIDSLQSDLTAVKSKTDTLTFSGTEVQARINDKGVLNDPSASEIDTELGSTHGTGSWEGDTAATVADAVWDEDLVDHDSAGTFGEKNQNLVPSENTDDYKADVSLLATESNATSNKEEMIAGIETNESMLVIIESTIARLLGLSDENVYYELRWIDNQNTSTTIEIYDSAANAETHDGSTGLVASYTMTAVYADGLPETITVIKE